ncbi:fungal hydrophobin [Obba rivulosa]|uniref:Hydrophobin n=1 Tax=Obba rivulosa TaxID=1052685 RepID=A0A8E2DMS3_9APHY|nr:fungal hydrophobin [Obba rivulosa]
MFSRVASFAVLAMPLLAVATPVELIARQDQQCSTGSIQCCDSVQDANSGGVVATLLGLLGIVAGDITGQVGLTCSPITVVGVGSGNACSANTVCCSDNALGGLISIGCLPVTL